MQRQLGWCLAGLVFLSSLGVTALEAQYAQPPQTYSMTETNSMFVPGMTVKIYRDGSKAITESSYPPRAENRKGYHVRGLFDLQAQKTYTWDLIDTSAPCTNIDFSGDWGDPFQFYAQQLATDPSTQVKVVGKETVNGFAAKVLELSDPKQPGKAKVWLDEKYGLLVKWVMIQPNGQAATMLEVTELSLAAPPASLFALPPACAGAPTMGRVTSSGGKTEASIGSSGPTGPAPSLPTEQSLGALEDDNTQKTLNGASIHVCPDGALLIGVDAQNDRFLCSKALNLPTLSLTVDTSTHRTFSYDNKELSVHVCPEKKVMVGWSQDKDWLVCAQLPPSGYGILPGFGVAKVDRPGETRVTEPNHPDRHMHACDPQGTGAPWAMSGIQAADNVLVCMDSSVQPAPPKGGLAGDPR